MSTVLVTGGSGFIGAHTILQLLAAGHVVRTTVRSLDREAVTRSMLQSAGGSATAPLSFHAAELERDAGWAEAVTGCDYVLHVASPFPAAPPRHEEELIIPARDGALRVLRAARAARVRRVVLTSSFAAIGYGQPGRRGLFDEGDWTDPTQPGLGAYVKSKTLAERAAWDFVQREGGGLELTVVNPVLVLGPVLGPDFASSIQLIQRMIDGGMPACPRLHFGVVDVRDVADLHLRAMSAPAARGERLLAAAGPFMSLLAIARVLRERLGVAGRRAPTREVPDWVVRLAALARPEARQILSELGQRKDASHDKAVRLLGWSPRSNEEAILATAESLLRLKMAAPGGSS